MGGGGVAEGLCGRDLVARDGKDAHPPVELGVCVGAQGVGLAGKVGEVELAGALGRRRDGDAVAEEGDSAGEGAAAGRGGDEVVVVELGAVEGEPVAVPARDVGAAVEVACGVGLGESEEGRVAEKAAVSVVEDVVW